MGTFFKVTPEVGLIQKCFSFMSSRPSWRCSHRWTGVYLREFWGTKTAFKPVFCFATNSDNRFREIASELDKEELNQTVWIMNYSVLCCIRYTWAAELLLYRTKTSDASCKLGESDVKAGCWEGHIPTTGLLTARTHLTHFFMKVSAFTVWILSPSATQRCQLCYGSRTEKGQFPVCIWQNQ